MSGLAALLAEHNPPSVYQWHSAAPRRRRAARGRARRLERSATSTGGRSRTGRRSSRRLRPRSTSPTTTPTSVDALSDGLGRVAVDGRGPGAALGRLEPAGPQRRARRSTTVARVASRRARAHADAGKLAVILRGEGPTLDLAGAARSSTEAAGRSDDPLGRRRREVAQRRPRLRRDRVTASTAPPGSAASAPRCAPRPRPARRSAR